VKDENKNKFISSKDVKDKNGNILGAVCVAPAKEIGKRDILLMENSGTQSVRSITELINMLSKKDVSLEERKLVLDFLSERLRILEEGMLPDNSKKPKKPKK
jgi:CRISPR/Cas system-associated exonuclease Cas4 (RecB family)